MTMQAVEICNQCGRSVSFGSGLYVDRVPDFNDEVTRLSFGSTSPTGDYWCRDCDSKSSDDCDVEVRTVN